MSAMWTLHVFAVVDVGDVDAARLLALHRAVGDDRRTLPRRERHGLEVQPVLRLRDARDVVEHVHKVESHERVGRRLHRGEVVLRVKRPRMREVRLAARELVHRVGVGHVALHVLAPARELVDHAGLLLRQHLRGDAQRVARGTPVAVGRIVLERIGAREGRVDLEETPHLGAVVVSAADHRDEVRLAGYGARAVEERRHERVGAPHGELSDAVGVARHQHAAPVVRLVGVFPARVEDASVVRDVGGVVGVLLVGELANLAGLAVLAVHHGHRHVAVLAREELVRRRAEHHELVAVREVAGVPPLDVLVLLGRDELRLLVGHFVGELREVGLDLENAEEVVEAAVAGEEDARGIEVEVDVAHDGGLVRRLVERTERRRAADVAQHADLVLEARARGDHVVLGVESGHAAAASAERAARVADLAVDAEDLVEVEDRVREHRLAVVLHELHGGGLRRGVALLEVGLHLVDLRDQRLDGGSVLRVVVFRVVLEVRERAPRGLRLHESQLLARLAHGIRGERKRRAREKGCPEYLFHRIHSILLKVLRQIVYPIHPRLAREKRSPVPRGARPHACRAARRSPS